MKKDTLMKMLGALTAIVIIFAGLSKLLSYNSETLTEAAAKNQALLPSSEPEETDEPAMTASAETELSKESGDSVEVSDINSKRITYEDSFYYEPLSDTLKNTITGISYPKEETDEITYTDLNYVHVLHYDFNGEIQDGELICNTAIAQDLVEIFYELYVAQYSIEKIHLIDAYEGDDNASMEDNNTSCFNYRPIEGTKKLSQHAYGLAVDINPFYNPYIRYSKSDAPLIEPAGSEKYADRTQNFPYKIDENDLCYRLFIEHGFIWGGNWNSSKDYQHFQKNPHP